MSFNQNITLSEVFGGKTLDNRTIENLVSLLQPHYSGVLYVIDNILYAAPTVEECVARLRQIKTSFERPIRFHITDEGNNPNRQWEVRVANEPRKPSIFLSNKDVVDELVKISCKPQ